MRKHRFLIDNVVIGVLLLIAILFGFSFRFAGKDCGVTKINNVDDIKVGMVNLEYAIEPDEPWGEKGIQPYIEQLRDATIVAIAKPTGNLIQSYGAYGQEIQIKNILYGEEYLKENEMTWFYQEYGFAVIDDKIRFMNAYLNVMDPEDEYLVFLEPSPLNNYQKNQVYELTNHILGYISLSEKTTKNLPKIYGGIDYVEIKDYEFFAVSEKVTAELNEARKTIIEMYIK